MSSKEIVKLENFADEMANARQPYISSLDKIDESVNLSRLKQLKTLIDTYNKVKAGWHLLRGLSGFYLGISVIPIVPYLGEAKKTFLDTVFTATPLATWAGALGVLGYFTFREYSKTKKQKSLLEAQPEIGREKFNENVSTIENLYFKAIDRNSQK